MGYCKFVITVKFGETGMGGGGVNCIFLQQPWQRGLSMLKRKQELNSLCCLLQSTGSRLNFHCNENS